MPFFASIRGGWGGISSSVVSSASAGVVVRVGSSRWRGILAAEIVEGTSWISCGQARVHSGESQFLIL